jgi:hypothetical protein
LCLLKIQTGALDAGAEGVKVAAAAARARAAAAECTVLAERRLY